MIACRQCPSYKGGRGARACLTCPEINQSVILPRAKPCVEYIKIPREMLEELRDEGNISGINIYREVLNVEESILIFMLFTLEMTLREVADYQQKSKTSVDRQKKRCIDKISTYMINRKKSGTSAPS